MHREARPGGVTSCGRLQSSAQRDRARVARRRPATPAQNT